MVLEYCEKFFKKSHLQKIKCCNKVNIWEYRYTNKLNSGKKRRSERKELKKRLMTQISSKTNKYN